MRQEIGGEALDRLAQVFSELDSLPRTSTDPDALLLAAEEADFYGRELPALALRLRHAARALSQSVRMVV
ncbi:MAG TPA: hypothetical protein VFY54_17195 [Rubrobacter sp.]|nr:hypothetical protein [Rubrobacter sp.]